MKSLNLIFLSEMEDVELFSDYENALSDRVERKKTNVCEQESIRKLVRDLSPLSIPLEYFDGFFFSFTISHISKEFDLLKIVSDRSKILNIELKSQMIEVERIEKQLIQNQYYLRHISKEIYSFTYVASSSEVYYLDDRQSLCKTNIDHLGRILKEFENYMPSNIEELFRAKDFLISPMNTPEKFFAEEYFLTEQQDRYKDEILLYLQETSDFKSISITGGPGTGKTLMLYDVARELSFKGKVCIIHCGILSPGHEQLKSMLTGIDIISIRDVSLSMDFNDYSYILVDEAQRIYTEQFKIISSYAKQNNKACIFSYDSQQILSAKEENRNISEEITTFCKKKIKLSDKIRTNKELSTFISTLLNLKNKKNQNNVYDYSSVDILYARNSDEAVKMLGHLKKEYTFINFTLSNFSPSSYDVYGGYLNTHKVIGQEFDNVLMILDRNFYYNEWGGLSAYGHPCPDYLYRKLFFQGISRTRERLCLIIVDNIDLFRKINGIKMHKFECNP